MKVAGHTRECAKRIWTKSNVEGSYGNSKSSRSILPSEERYQGDVQLKSDISDTRGGDSLAIGGDVSVVSQIPGRHTWAAWAQYPHLRYLPYFISLINSTERGRAGETCLPSRLPNYPSDGPRIWTYIPVPYYQLLLYADRELTVAISSTLALGLPKTCSTGPRYGLSSAQPR